LLYLVAVAGAAVYLALQVVPYRPRNLVSLAGLAFLLLVGLLLSSKPVRIPWHTVFWGVALQFYLGIFVLRTHVGYNIVEWIGHRVEEFIGYTDAGSKFLFGDAYTMHPFVFKTMPITLFVNSMITVCYRLGIIQAIIATLGRFLAVCLHTTPIESVSAAANIFFSLTEIPLLVRPFLDHVTESELFAIMTGGFASISLPIVGIFVSFGIPASHLLAASVMSAPAALAVAKLMCPETSRNTKIKGVYKMDCGKSSNLLEAVSEAALTGVRIVVSICANALVFVAVLEFLDKTVEWFGDQAGVDNLSFTRILSYVFYPLMFLFGVDVEDLLTLGRLVGVKIVANIIVGYQQTGVIIRNSHTLADYLEQTNGTWRHVGDDVILDAWNQTLAGGVMTLRNSKKGGCILSVYSNLYHSLDLQERSTAIVTYILCGLLPLVRFCRLSGSDDVTGTQADGCPS
ncbi:hypothetical protein BaRGS_00014104, partial [Batillaria attramentaria]